MSGVLKSVFLFVSLLFVSRAFAADAEAARILDRCRAMLPGRPVTLVGGITLRTRKGFVRGEYDYTLAMDRSKTPATVSVELREKDSTNVVERVSVTRPGPVPDGRVLGTDVAWLDLTLDFLWWPEAAFDAEREGESMHGETCDVLRVSDGRGKTVRAWVGRDTGALMQAEELGADGKALRRLWGTSVKKFGDRWVPGTVEVETLGSRHRTKIVINELR